VTGAAFALAVDRNANKPSCLWGNRGRERKENIKELEKTHETVLELQQANHFPEQFAVVVGKNALH
jgi:hypothetical protein